MNVPHISRRHFLRLGAGTVVVGLGACSSSGRHVAAPTAGTASSLPSPASTTSTTSGTTTTPGTPPASTAPGSLLGGRRLVIVQMMGGNDGLNAVVPSDGRYRDARPSLAIGEADLVALKGTTDVALHPSLAPLVPFWDAGHLALVRGIGFENPNRSHFVSMDRWWRADDVTAPGWLGRVLDGLPEEPTPLYAASIGGGAPLLNGAQRLASSIVSASGFAFEGLDPKVVRALSGAGGAPAASASGEGALLAAARHAFARAVDAVTAFAAVVAAPGESSGTVSEREGGATLTAGLAVAAKMLAADVGTQIVVVSASGFDTHANQLTTQKGLLDDFAKGTAAFFDSATKSGLDVLLVTTSEFGRRVAENGSGGTDHGAGNVSFAIGGGVRGGLFGEVNLADQLDGDVRPTVDPRALYTTCLDWIGADAAATLGKRYDGVKLLV